MFVDNGNMGQLIVPMYAEQLGEDKTIQVIKEDFGGKAKATHSRCANRATEIWVNLAKLIERREIILPNDPVLIAQLTTREIETMSNGLLRLVSKSVTKHNGGKSPDRADAVALAAQDIQGRAPEQRFDYKTGGHEEEDKTGMGWTGDGKFYLG
jgi:hypothetical protein